MMDTESLPDDGESLADRPPIVAESLADTKALCERVKNPLAGINLRTKRGRLLREIYRTRMAVFDDADVAADMTIQLAVRRVAELQVIGDSLRGEIIAAPQFDVKLSKELVRIENLIRRAEVELAELIAEATKPLSWYEQQQVNRAQ